MTTVDFAPTARLRRACAALLALLLTAAVCAPAFAAIGDPAATILDALPAEVDATDDGYRLGDGLAFRIEERGGLAYRVAGEGVFDEATAALAASLLAAGTGYGDAIVEPLTTFFTSRLGELVGRGAVVLGVEEYALQLEVSGDAAPYRVSFTLSLPRVDDAAFPPAAHVLGPADARYVIREFSDFQCPFCARFVESTLPLIKEQLLARGDVRFEFHHFPLQSIHANAAPAAEAAECVAAVNAGPLAGSAGDAPFWRFHDALFARQQAWQDLGDPDPYFVRLADDLGLGQPELAACLQERRFAQRVQDAYQAASELRLTGTPTVFVNGYRARGFNELDTYLELFGLIDAFEGPEGDAAPSGSSRP